MTTSRPLEGKLAIVTGASRGIGAAIAENLAAKGARVVLNFTSSSSLEPTKALAAHLTKEHSTECAIVQADMGSLDSPQKIVDAAKSLSKDGKIDIIINNAGVARNQLLEEVTAEEFYRQYNINVLGPLLLMQAATAFLPKDSSGRIINVSSVSSSFGAPGQSVYGGTKAALEAMTRTWARELQERATVNSVNPGPVDTDMYGGSEPWFKEVMRPFVEHTPGMNAINGKGRDGTPKEVAGVVGMLCLPESQWTNGSVVSCNGGMLMTL